MPFKGDMRLGGRHSNVASLNGTASDIVSVPAYGTVLSGPTDTSRYESDYIQNSFYMPYSTTVYADGLGGQNSVETWGLQYLPAGWITGNSYTDNIVYVYPLSNSYSAGQDTHRQIEDGTGINYQGGVVGTEWQSYGTHIGNFDSYGYYWDGNGGYYQGNPTNGWTWSYNNSSSFNWTSPNSAESGTFTYFWSACNYTANGMGGYEQSCGMGGYSNGQPVANGYYYTYEPYDYYDIDGNGPFTGYQEHKQVWSYYYDGGSSYYSNGYQEY